jgi:hypothetical protein
VRGAGRLATDDPHHVVAAPGTGLAEDCFGLAIVVSGGKVGFMTYAKTMNAALFLVFLGRLLRSTTGKVFLISDHLKAHETKVVEDWVAAHQDRLELFWLPSRSPELNADEYLNQDLKGNVNAEGLPDK